MTNDQTHNLTAGDTFERHTNGIVSRYRIAAVKFGGTCTNERSGAYGHAYAYVSCYMRDETSTARMEFSIESDEYLNGQRYPTHDKDGNRVRGVEIVTETAAA